MKNNILLKVLLIGVMGSVGALAKMTVDKSNSVLTITSDTSGTVVAKVIGPDNEVIINETYEGNSFSWAPSGGDGAYRYDVRVKDNYAGGSVEVVNGQILIQNSEEE